MVLLYNRQDRPVVKEIADCLTGLGASVWFDGHIEPSDNWRRAVIDSIREAEAIVVVMSAAAMQSKEIPLEVQHAMDHGKRIFGIRIETFGIDSESFFLLRLTHQLDGYDARSRRDACQAVLAKIRPGSAAAPENEFQASPLTHADCPYRGPLPFGRAEADLFCGRAKEVQEALDVIQGGQLRLIKIHGPSGAGKTSFVQALLVPVLERNGYHTPAPMRIAAPASEDAAQGTAPDVYVREQITSPGGETRVTRLAEVKAYLAAQANRVAEETRGTVLIFDQFEELFTYGYADEIETQCFLDLREALERFPRLRVILIFREEYLAQIARSYEGILPAAEGSGTPAGPVYAEIRLRPMDESFAIEAICEPARRKGVAFDRGVAASIAHELRKVKVIQDGVPVQKDVKKYIEPVHLQIVCRDIWQRLPEGITAIDRNRVGLALRRSMDRQEPMQSTSLDGLLFYFIADVLERFYDEVVARTQEAAAEAKKSYPEKLVRMGCLQFVTAGGHRALIRSDAALGRVGRLPFWVVRVLEDQHFLRADQRGTATWYELAHDKLTQPVQTMKDRDAQQLLLGLDTLSAAMKRMERGSDGLKGVFEEHDSVLRGLHEFEKNDGLFADEAQFVLRSALRSGTRVLEWGLGLCREFESVVISVLEEALGHPEEDVRVNAVRLLFAQLAPARGQDGLPRAAEWAELEDHAFALALSDASERVRQAAARGLARTARPRHLESLVHAITAERDGKARELFSRMRDDQERRAAGEEYETASRRLRRMDRLRVFFSIAGLRSRESLRGILLISATGCAATALAVMVVRGAVAAFGLTLTQAEYKAAMGMFHGVTGGVGWGFTVPLAVVYCWVVLQGGRPWRNARRAWASCTLGTSAGLVTGFLLTMIILKVFNKDSLIEQGWIYGDRRWHDSLLRTRMGWTMIVQGFSIGLGCATGLYTLCRSRGWQELMRAERPAGRKLSKRFLLARLTRLALPHTMVAAVCLAAGAVILHFLMIPGDGFYNVFPARLLPYKILGDGLSIYAGCLSLLVGASYGFFLNVTGFTFQAHRAILPNQEPKP